MRIDTFLFENGFVKSRTKAKDLLCQNRVVVDGKIITKPSFDISNENKIEILEAEKDEFISRGGEKLKAALDSFNVNVENKVCADIGASTGGFTDCLLKNGAAKVFAVDSGKDQLAEELKSDKRVISFEGVNARYIDPSLFNGEKVSVVVMDVSFISQKLLYEAINNITLMDADIITLIKPQFEVGKQRLGKNGIVKDEKARLEVIEDIKETGKIYGFSCMGVITSPIKGGSGNTEYLIHFKKVLS